MENATSSDPLSTFLQTGIYRFEKSNAIFIDPVRVLNRSYTHHKLSPSAYYSRTFQPVHPKKRKRNHNKPVILNYKERLAEQRHQEVRPLLLRAHEELLRATELLEVIKSVKGEGGDESGGGGEVSGVGVESEFVDLGKVWQAPFYEIALSFPRDGMRFPDEGELLIQHSKERVFPVFNNLVVNETSNDAEAEFLGSRYIIPRDSGFYMIHNLIPVNSSSGYNLIVVDPPWENGSARQKSRYPTLPNRYFLSLPVKQLTHSDGALVALWVTNREKLRRFVEEELLPAWGVSYMATLYWLKVKPDGLMIGDLDLFHHRPYECLILGYCHKRETESQDFLKTIPVQDEQIIISVPGDYSRKPPIGDFLFNYAPSFKAARGIELFAREMIGGWTSWGNEPLHFQKSKYFAEE